MRPMFLVFMLILFSSITTTLVTLVTGLRLMIVIGSVVTVVCAILWICSRYGLIAPAAGIVFLIIAFIALGATFLGSRDVIQKVVPYCGDGVCAANECDGTCPDCQPGMCDDGTCVPDWETCDTSPDCVCSAQSVCRPGETADRFGCTTIICGDDHCDEGEDRFSCCFDCGCLEDYACQNNICFFQTPKITFTTHVVSDNISATSLMANPMLYNASQKIHPLILLRVRNEVANARSVTVLVKLGPYDNREIFVGDMLIGQVVPVQIHGPYDPRILAVDNDTEITVSVDISYSDDQEVSHTPQWVFPMTIRGRNILDKYTHPVFYITPDDIELTSTKLSAIWQNYRDIIVLPDEPGMRFPLETLERNAGDPDDIAVLLASAFYAADHKVSIVESDHGLFVRVWDDRTFIILDPEKINLPYKEAEAGHPGYSVWELPDTWEYWNSTTLSLSVLDQEG